MSRPGARRQASVRLVIFLVFTAALCACDIPVKTPQEVAARVLANREWVEDARACPADVMPSEMRVGGTRSVNCEGSAAWKCFAHCRRDDIDGCYWLAQALLEVEQEEASKVVFQRACILGDPSGCTNRAAFMKDARAREAQACTARTFGRTCEAKDSWGCTMYGRALHRGIGVPRDDARALEILAGGCEPDDLDSPSCVAARKLMEQIRAEQGADSAPQ